MAKKTIIIATLLIVIVCIAAAAVILSNDDGDDDRTDTADQGDRATIDPGNESITDQGNGNTTDTGGDGTTGHRVLVAYFSGSGNTERVAQNIADTTGGTLFEITPVDPYTSADLDWTDPDSRVNREHNDSSLRDIALTSTTVDGWDGYDTVFIGYPIWWGDAAWPIDNFVKDNDFTGKTVIPFCTSSSSPIGNSGTNLENMASTGTWLEGHRFSSGASSDTVTTGVEGLNLG